jgi:arylsulfatase A-like enzyme
MAQKAFLVLSIFALLSCGEQKAVQDLPNILWLTSEDNGTFLGCYGDEFATTPNLDRMAAEGFRYTHAFANAPVCAPARNTIITGVYANSGGNQHMRSRYDKSDQVHFYPEFLREAGYYCTNNSKEDYNIDQEQTRGIWDESSKDAHYKNRAPGQPFFAIFNTTTSHESSIHKWIPTEELRHKPEDVTLPPYHPDTPELRHDWAQYYDKIEDMDGEVGEYLAELEQSGEADNTIVFYYADHGGVLARSKRYVYETGTHVPFIIRIPEKYKHLYPAESPGMAVNRIVSFVDLAPTLLSIIGTPVPEFMQGSAFLGEQKTADPEYAFMFRGRMDERYDMCRAVRDQKYRYIRNYMPYRIYGQYLEYLWRAPSVGSWEEACEAGQCNDIQQIFWNPKPVEELYDTENDPWEVHNLAGDPAYAEVLQRMREANRGWMTRIKDTGFIPEAELIDRTMDMPAYDYMRSDRVDMPAYMQAAETATTSGDIGALKDLLASVDAVQRYWGASGLLIMGDKARPVLDALKVASTDESVNVSAMAAEALYKLGEQDIARIALAEALKSDNAFARLHALNVIITVEDKSEALKEAVVAMVKAHDELDRNNYDLRLARSLFIKWDIDPATYEIEFPW